MAEKRIAAGDGTGTDRRGEAEIRALANGESPLCVIRWSEQEATEEVQYTQ